MACKMVSRYYFGCGAPFHSNCHSFVPLTPFISLAQACLFTLSHSLCVNFQNARSIYIVANAKMMERMARKRKKNMAIVYWLQNCTFEMKTREHQLKIKRIGIQNSIYCCSIFSCWLVCVQSVFFLRALSGDVWYDAAKIHYGIFRPEHKTILREFELSNELVSRFVCMVSSS